MKIIGISPGFYIGGSGGGGSCPQAPVVLWSEYAILHGGIHVYEELDSSCTRSVCYTGFHWKRWVLQWIWKWEKGRRGYLKSKSFLPPGLPSDDKWLTICRNIDKLDQVGRHFISFFNMKLILINLIILENSCLCISRSGLTCKRT